MAYNRIGQQFHAMFGIFMVTFYLGIGIFLLFFVHKYFVIDRALCVIMGTSFVLYGLYRIYHTIKLIKEAFSKNNNDTQ